MNKFTRGTVVYHKVMGKGVTINQTQEGMIEVRMVSGLIEKFYPEELETEHDVDAKNKNYIAEDKNWSLS